MTHRWSTLSVCVSWALMTCGVAVGMKTCTACCRFIILFSKDDVCLLVAGGAMSAEPVDPAAVSGRLGTS